MIPRVRLSASNRPGPTSSLHVVHTHRHVPYAQMETGGTLFRGLALSLDDRTLKHHGPGRGVSHRAAIPQPREKRSRPRLRCARLCSKWPRHPWTTSGRRRAAANFRPRFARYNTKQIPETGGVSAAHQSPRAQSTSYQILVTGKWGENNSKTDVEVAAVRVVPVAKRATREPVVVEERAAAQGNRLNFLSLQ